MNRVGEAAETIRKAWHCGALTIAVDANDGGAARWIAEALEPWFRPTLAPPDWRIKITSSAQAFAELGGLRGDAACLRPCFAFDQWVLSLPTWSSNDRVVIADAQRSGFLIVTPNEIEIVGDPCTRRWRMTSIWALHEIMATRLRRTHLDLHAASVEAGGRVLLLIGHKEAGKTTLSLHLLRSGHFRAIANDRAFVGAPGKSFEVVGLPTVIKIRPPTVTLFPELRRGLPSVERPYLYTLDELAVAIDEPDARPGELALTPAQLLRQLDVGAAGPTPLGAVVFPEIRTDAEGWKLERLTPNDVDAGLWKNLYGSPLERDATAIFTQTESAPTQPSRELAGAIATTLPGYRLLLGRNAYADPDLARRLAEIAHPS